MESLPPFDALIVGAGPAGLSCAIKLKRLKPDFSVCVLEKGPEVGAHILSGAVFDPVALNALFPGWEEDGAPVKTRVTQDRMYYYARNRAFRLPLLPAMRNDGNYVVSLSELCRWLGEKASALGVEIFPGFAAQEALFDESGAVCGVRTGETGVNKHGERTARYAPGAEIRARHTVFAEGCRGHVFEALAEKMALRAASSPQTYGLGIKELWEFPAGTTSPGRVEHGIGYPLGRNAYGGSFLYHLSDTQIAIGLVTGLDYANPYLDPYEEFQRFKNHPSVRPLLEKGRRVAYGARALNEGGIDARPALAFRGGSVVGCAAGFMNAVRIKGSHNAMASGIMLAETLAASGDMPHIAEDYPRRVENSAMERELWTARNVRPAFAKFGPFGGMAYAAFDQFVLGGMAPWTLKHTRTDRSALVPAAKATPITYPPHDGKVTFDKLASVQYSGTHHAEDQPSHLRLRRPDDAVPVNYSVYAAPETRYCPAAVYEYIADKHGNAALHVNASNCVHCKTCDIKDPEKNIRWTAPEGGGGPRYPNM
ncbi:MAG: electron transfer flavoprotein-ubiquinone oxidoreductase [Rickettsiales bacterium]